MSGTRKTLTAEEYYAGMRRLALRPTKNAGTDKNELWATVDGEFTSIPKADCHSGEELYKILERKKRFMGIGFTSADD